MAGQSLERRDVLRMLATAAAAASFHGFSRWSFACGHIGNSVAQIKPAAYRPLFFAAPEYELLERLTEIIIPADDSPGAKEAGVAEFIDLMVSRDPDLQHRFRGGIEELNARTHAIYGNLFLAVTPSQQISMLDPLAYKEKFRAGEEQARAFFELVRQYTVMGFYTSEIGLKELNFPGLAFYADSPACSHPNDREHLHLSSPDY